MRLLVSVRDAGEALAAARGGAELIDLKEPRHGALGALPLDSVRAIVAALRTAGATQTISATIGDVPLAPLEALVGRVAALAQCGVDLVKVGIERRGEARAALDALARAPAVRVVPVFIADRGLDADLLAHAAARPFAALMLDTADKRGGSLFERVDDERLSRFVALAHAAGHEAGLAGALRFEHLDRLAALAPDFAGFRGAVCDGGREAALVPARVRELRRRLDAARAGVVSDANAPSAA